MKNLNQFSDSELYSICKKWGRQALDARRRFAGLLPEVWRREMESRGGDGGMADQLNLLTPQKPPRKSWLEKRGYTCIYEFAARLAGMSRKQVDLVLRLGQRFADTPVLHAALVEGKISANKLARVASIATAENQHELLRKTEILSSRALEIYVRELKTESDNENPNGFNKTNIDQKVLHVHHFDTRENDYETGDETTGAGNGSTTNTTHDTTPNSPTDATPDADILAAFSPELKHKIRELKAKGIDVNSLFMEFLQKRENEIKEEMEKLGQEQLQARLEKHIIGKPTSRHVPAIIKKIVTAKYGNVCSAPHCGKPAAHIHHQKPFATFGSHDPRHLRPLCKAHHELAHVEEGGYVGVRGGG